MDRVGDFVTQSASEFVGVLHEVQQRIDDINVPTRGGKRVRLRFVNQIELEGMVVSRLRRSRDGLRNRPQLIV